MFCETHNFSILGIKKKTKTRYTDIWNSPVYVINFFKLVLNLNNASKKIKKILKQITSNKDESGFPYSKTE